MNVKFKRTYKDFVKFLGETPRNLKLNTTITGLDLVDEVTTEMLERFIKAWTKNKFTK